jgi:catechol 2,3-dioxygenase-like lactoylglutathione lyase family enzyme
MLNNRSAYATIPASDIARAKSWYEEKLGLTPSWEGEPGMLYNLPDGAGFLLYPTEHAGKAPNTLMSFTSDDVEKDVTALKQKGVVFPRHRRGWFEDSEFGRGVR